MTVTVERTEKLDLVAAMDWFLFPADDHYPVQIAQWWLAYRDGYLAGYCGARMIGDDAYLCRAGVLNGHRGHGIQRKLIAARVRWARRHGAARVISDTAPWNVSSSNNLIRCGFTTYAPQEEWREVAIYWERALL